MTDFVFLDIDTQKEFVEHFGRKAIPDCPKIRENLMELMSFAMHNKIPVISPVSAETTDSEKVIETEISRGAAQQSIFEHTGANPFQNENLMRKLEALAPQTVVVFGVPLETSVSEAVRTLSGQTDYKIWVVRDVVKGYTDEEETLAELRKLKNVSLMSARNTIKFLAEINF